ncbi:MAG: hypothetical protein Q8O76_12510, partial [Chloroflexota bacterium]|nr:hypothetical protein [Chloroflexota bacterium]
VFPIALWVNKTLEEMKTVTVPAGKTAPVTFTVTRSEEATYDVRVDKHFGKFVISSAVVFDWTPVIIAIVVLGVLVIAALVYFFWVRRR